MKILKFAILFFAIASYDNPSSAEGDLNHIVHIVLIWLNEPGNEVHINKVIETTHALQAIPQVLDIRVGDSIMSDRPIVDDSFDVGLYIIFDSKSSLKQYLEHPLHQEAVKSTLKPLSKKILVYDFEDKS